jgi:hypothetical protein
MRFEISEASAGVRVIYGKRTLNSHDCGEKVLNLRGHENQTTNRIRADTSVFTKYQNSFFKSGWNINIERDFETGWGDRRRD